MPVILVSTYFDWAVYIILTDRFRSLPVQSMFEFLFGLIGIMNPEDYSGQYPITKQYFLRDCLMGSDMCSCQQLVNWCRWTAIQMQRPPQVVTCRHLGRWTRAYSLSRTVLSSRSLQTLLRWICRRQCFDWDYGWWFVGEYIWRVFYRKIIPTWHFA